MEAVANRRPGRPARLSREAVLRAAVSVADEGGLDALTMQRVGEQVGAEAMSLYRHVRNKEDLLDGIVDLVYAEMELPEPGRLAAGHARAGDLGSGGPPPASVGDQPDGVALEPGAGQPPPPRRRFGILLAAGFSSAMTTHAYNLLDSFIYGFVLQETTLPFGTQEEMGAMAESMMGDAPEMYPNLGRVASELMAAGFDVRRRIRVRARPDPRRDRARGGDGLSGEVAGLAAPPRRSRTTSSRSGGGSTGGRRSGWTCRRRRPSSSRSWSGWASSRGSVAG